jgi:hypothetical protein
MNKFRTVAVALEGTEDLDLPPSPFVVAERFSINRAISVLALRLFSSEEIAKLALATDFTLRDLLGAQERLRDTLWIELRYAMVEEPAALRLAFPGSKSDPESHENRALVRKLKRLDLEIARQLAWVVVVVAKSELLDRAIQGTKSGRFSITDIDVVVSRRDRRARESETTRFGYSIGGRQDCSPQDFAGTPVCGSSRTYR